MAAETVVRCSRLSRVFLLFLATACDDGIVTDPYDLPIVVGMVSEPVVGGFTMVLFDNRTGRRVTADLCDIRLEFRLSPTSTHWDPVDDDRLSDCSNGLTNIEPGGYAQWRVPIPVRPGWYRMQRSWEYDDGKRARVVNPPFELADETPVLMRLLDFTVTNDTVPVEFWNQSSYPWHIDICGAIRFERFQLGRFYWSDVGDRTEPCTVAPIPALAPFTSVVVDIPLHLGLGGRLRIRAGYTGPFGEVAVGWSGDFVATGGATMFAETGPIRDRAP